MLKQLSMRRPAGFTLLEMLITVAVIGILARFAYPSFVEQIRKSRRSDAMDALAAVVQQQERWRSNNSTYASSLTGAWPGTGLGLTSASSGAYYTISVSGTSATAYTATATAVSGKSQASDSGCTAMSVVYSAGSLTYSPTSCWLK